MLQGNKKGPKLFGFLYRAHSWLSHRVHNMTRRQRIISGSIAGVIALAAIIPTASHLIDTWRYDLDQQTLSLVGSINKDLVPKLKFNSQKSQWEFNQIAESTDTEMPASLVAQAGGSGKDDKSLYSTTFPTDPSKGVTFSDTQTKLSFTMTPEFGLYEGRANDGRLIYPMKNGAKLIYTAKNNGMKEDIVLPKFIEKELEFSYKLNLPKTLEAKIMDDGAIGIFSADPILFGAVSTSSDMDTEKLKSARENGEKNHLLFAIPAPVIVQSGGGKTKANAKFGLAGDVLTVTARDMDTVTYPASVDPSVVVTSSSDFSNGGNNEGNIYYSTDQINRGKVTGGSVSSWSTTTAMDVTTEKLSTVAYNGYLYMMGGYRRSPSGSFDTTYYAPINSNGTLGSWTSTTSLPALYNTTEIIAYNGYMYLIADQAYVTSPSNVATTYYSKINSNGTLGSWTMSTDLPQAIVNHAVVAANGYIYTLGGSPTSGGSCGANGDCMNTVYYAPLNANGSIGTWNTTTSFSGVRAVAKATSYNGYLYLGGGGSSTYLNDVQYAKINNDGTLGSWVSTTSFTGARYGHQFAAYNGYLYLYSGRGSSWFSDVQIAQINANGSIGAWTTTTSFSTGRAYGGGAIYKGYVYMLGGYNGSTNFSDVQYAKIDPPGIASTNSSSTTFGGAIDAGTGGCGFMYNGYLYYIGGYNGTAYSAQARYASINTSGAVSTWATTSALTAPIAGGSGLGGGACAISNNRIYMIGGTTSTAGGTTSVASIQYASFNSNGTLSSWTLNPTDYVNAFTNQTAVAYNGQVYAVGLSGGGASNRIYRAPVNSDGTLGSWVWDGNGTNNLAASTSSAGMVVYNKFIYLLGGYNSPNYLNTVQYAAINSDGSLGTWNTTTALSSVKDNLSVAIVNGYLYTLGGETTGGTYSNAVEFAKINSDGSIGSWQSSANLSVTYSNGGTAVWNDRIYLISGRNNGTRGKNVLYVTTRSGGGGINNGWTTSGNTFTARQGHGSVVANGYLYVLGGITTGGSRIDSVQYAAIGDDGSVGTWATTTSLPSARAGIGVVAYGNNLFIFGGKTGPTSVTDSVHSAPLNSNGTIGAWTALPNLPDQVSSMAVTTRSGYVYLLGGVKSTTNDNVWYARMNGDGTLGT